jgi:chitinase
MKNQGFDGKKLLIFVGFSKDERVYSRRRQDCTMSSSFFAESKHSKHVLAGYWHFFVSVSRGRSYVTESHKNGPTSDDVRA